MGKIRFLQDFRQSLVDMANLVEGAVSELDAVVADRKPASGIIDNSHPPADRGLGLLARLQNEDHFVVLQRQRFIPPPSDRAIWRRSALPWVDVLTDVPAAEQG